METENSPVKMQSVFKDFLLIQKLYSQVTNTQTLQTITNKFKTVAHFNNPGTLAPIICVGFRKDGEKQT
jgi:hypothetical protein